MVEKAEIKLKKLSKNLFTSTKNQKSLESEIKGYENKILSMLNKKIQNFEEGALFLQVEEQPSVDQSIDQPKEEGESLIIIHRPHRL